MKNRISLDDPNYEPSKPECDVVIQDHAAKKLWIILGIIALILTVFLIANCYDSKNHNRAISCAQEVLGDTFNTGAYKIAGSTDYPTYQVTGYGYINNTKYMLGVKIVLKEGRYYSYYDVEMYPVD